MHRACPAIERREERIRRCTPPRIVEIANVEIERIIEDLRIEVIMYLRLNNLRNLSGICQEKISFRSQFTPSLSQSYITKSCRTPRISISNSIPTTGGRVKDQRKPCRRTDPMRLNKISSTSPSRECTVYTSTALTSSHYPPRPNRRSTITSTT